MPVLSVIMPVYNAAKFLDRAVRSVLASTFQDFELLLIDDGSTDGSGALCDEMAHMDPRITVIHKPNGGASSARNKGIELAQGQFVAFADSDDYVDRTLYEKLLNAAGLENDLVICDIVLHYSDNDLPRETVKVEEERNRTIGNLLQSGIGGGPCHMVVKRSIIGTLRFPEYIFSGEDLWFTLRLYLQAGHISKVKEPLYFYNQENQGSITHSRNPRFENSILQMMKENRAILKDYGVFDSVRKEFYWSVLRFKSLFALDPERCSLYRSHIPEANKYVTSCPLLSPRVKIIMLMLNLRMDFAVRPLLRLFVNKETA